MLSFTLQDYIGQDLMGLLNTPYFLELAAVVDPWSYRDRMTIPKLVLSAAGDEFFCPDSPQYFMPGLRAVGETHLSVVANAEHSMASGWADVAENLMGFYHTVLYDLPRPNYTYELIYGVDSASIVVTTGRPL
jgi:PhoPQ-activated pathogenicity-related protein